MCHITILGAVGILGISIIYIYLLQAILNPYKTQPEDDEDKHELGLNIPDAITFMQTRDVVDKRLYNEQLKEYRRVSSTSLCSRGHSLPVVNPLDGLRYSS